MEARELARYEAKPTDKYPANSLMPIANPRFFCPTISTFIITVEDHANPWLIPNKIFAIITHDHESAYINKNGTGKAANQPAINICFLLNRLLSLATL